MSHILQVLQNTNAVVTFLFLFSISEDMQLLATPQPHTEGKGKIFTWSQNMAKTANKNILLNRCVNGRQ